MEQFDYIVVGAGSAGCVVARRLSEADPRLGILLLEAGISDTADARLAPLIRTPGTFEDLQGSAVDWQYLTEPQDNLTRPVPRVSWPRGKVLGGSSAISSMVYVRGNRRDFDNWVDLGNVGWGYADLLPLFIKSERNLRPGISTRFHGTTGPMTVRDVPAPDPASVAFVRAAQEAGYGTTDDFNDFEQEGGAGLYQVNVDEHGNRVSAADAFLRDPPANLTVRTQAEATRVLVEGGRAVGVLYVDTSGGHPVTRNARAGREVIVAGGAVNSPKLLLLSGLGPADQLRQFGIPVTCPLPGVGANLKDHPITAVVHLYAPGKSAQAPTAGGAEAGLFLRLRPGATAPDLQFQFTHRILGKPPALAPEAGFMIVPTLIRPRSVGSLRLRSGDPSDAPEIRANYLADPEDTALLVEGLKVARLIARAGPLDEFRGPEIAPGPGVMSDTDLADYVRRTVGGLFHPIGTCKMGPKDDPMAVVDARLRVRGVRGLRVADASVMPVIPSGNTHAPTVMIGEKAALMILEDRRGCVGPGGNGVPCPTPWEDGMPGPQDSVAGELPRFFSVDSAESVFLRFAEGTGEVRPDGQGINVNLRLFTLDGQPDGTELCNGEVRVKGGLNEFLNPPPNPNVTDRETGAIAEVPVTSLCQAKWTFADGSTITAIGKGTSTIVPTAGRGGIMADKAAMIITGGSGRFANARGGVTIDTAAYLDDTMRPPVGQPGAKVNQKTILVFRVVPERR